MNNFYGGSRRKNQEITGKITDKSDRGWGTIIGISSGTNGSKKDNVGSAVVGSRGEKVWVVSKPAVTGGVAGCGGSETELVGVYKSRDSVIQKLEDGAGGRGGRWNKLTVHEMELMGDK